MKAAEPNQPLEIWGGVECTVSRSGDSYYDQLECNGHARRISDLEIFASLGLRTLRSPFVWERIAPVPGVEEDWSWAKKRLEKMAELGQRPIAGLLHHGSGPRHTSLVDPDFPEKFAVYARRFAEHFPHVEDYTPINEPLTTARFSTLYGFWYPHAQNDRLFARAVLNQCAATVLAMREIRKVNPRARLIQTEDLGRISGSPPLRYQVDFENERRWLVFDLLAGRLSKDRPMHRFLRQYGHVTADDLKWFEDNPCPPDIMGLNHYVTSNRYLDMNLERYPRHRWGGNHRHAYVDVEAVRVGPEVPTPPSELLQECFARYGLPLAVTEIHLDCTRDEQMRWLKFVWEEALAARAQGVPVQAITAWGLLGHFDWRCFMTRREGHYEVGAYDIRQQGGPRPTGLARTISQLAHGQKPEHPVLAGKGWWERPLRVLYGEAPAAKVESQSPPLLITGGQGRLARAFARLCDLRHLPYRLLSRADLDIGDAAAVQRLIEEIKPWAVINTAGFVRIDEAEYRSEQCYRDNLTGPLNLAWACRAHGLPLVHFSSNLVFDGQSRRPYREGAHTGPLNVYGRSKAEADAAILQAHSRALILRTSAFFGPWDEGNFLTLTLQRLARGEKVRIADGLIVSPTYLPDLVNTSLDLLIDGESGLWHAANLGEISWLDFAREGARRLDLDQNLLLPCALEEIGYRALRPRYSALASDQAQMLPTLDEALRRYFADCEKLPGPFNCPTPHLSETQEQP